MGIVVDGLGAAALCRARQVILINNLQFGQVLLHRLWSHEREERVDTVLREVVWKGSKEKSSEGAPEAKSIGITLAISKAPGSQIVRCKVVCEEPVSSSERNSIAEDCPANCVTYRGIIKCCTWTGLGAEWGLTRAKTSTIHYGLRLFCLETNIEFEVVDVAIKLLCSVSNLCIRVPLPEGLVP